MSNERGSGVGGLGRDIREILPGARPVILGLDGLEATVLIDGGDGDARFGFYDPDEGKIELNDGVIPITTGDQFIIGGLDSCIVTLVNRGEVKPLKYIVSPKRTATSGNKA